MKYNLGIIWIQFARHEDGVNFPHSQLSTLAAKRLRFVKNRYLPYQNNYDSILCGLCTNLYPTS
jgi:hypothetical protein